MSLCTHKPLPPLRQPPLRRSHIRLLIFTQTSSKSCHHPLSPTTSASTQHRQSPSFQPSTKLPSTTTAPGANLFRTRKTFPHCRRSQNRFTTQSPPLASHHRDHRQHITQRPLPHPRKSSPPQKIHSCCQHHSSRHPPAFRRTTCPLHPSLPPHRTPCSKQLPIT